MWRLSPSRRHGRTGRVHTPGILWRLYGALRGTEQSLVRPAPELPLVVIAHSPGERAPAAELRGALEETWLTVPERVRRQYQAVLRSAPPMAVVLLRRLSPCGCLGHHHPPGTESRIARTLRARSGVKVAELDLAYQGIREWQPLPLSDLAAGPSLRDADREEMDVFRYRLGLLDVFLHELHHYAMPHEPEHAVRARSRKFYADVLDAFTQTHFGVPYGLEGVMNDE